MNQVVINEYKNQALEFTDLTTISDRMKNKKILVHELVGKNTGWFMAYFITMEADEAGKPTKVIFATRVIDEEMKQKEQLIYKTQTDELTGLLNRRAYEEKIYERSGIPTENEFVYVSLDANGLKEVNDNKSHAAGDELLIGLSECMKASFGKNGEVFRTGGDEFVAILFCDMNKAKAILSEFDKLVSNWHGKIIDRLSVSYGYVDKYEFPSASTRELGAIAEQRMYDQKNDYYHKQGYDRRGQHDAHKKLCELYTKILKINITNDTFKIVNMDLSEQTSAKGYAEKISVWLKSFGTTGQVHPDDLNEYLRLTDLDYIKSYFDGNKTSLHIFYRRKCNNEFKQVMMEIVPANDYSKTNQSLFLYVKSIDK